MHANTTSTRVLTIVLVVLMSASTFTTQRQLMMKNMPASALDNPFAQQQKILLYVLPLIFAVSGINFPIGVLIYWLVTNVWSMGQQFYVIRRMPAPGSPAEKAMEERRARRHGGPAAAAAALLGRGSGDATDGSGSLTEEPGRGGTDADAAGRQRQQPKRQPKSKRGPAAASRGPAPSGPKRSPAGGASSGDPAARGGEGERPSKGR
jgi:YidC/Oxa1 family membrane protein insertase